MKINLLVALSLVVLVVCGTGNIALGQEEVTESATISLYITSNALKLGPGRTYVTWESFGVSVSDTAQGLFNGTTSRCLAESLYEKDSWESEGYCVYTMKDGEKVFGRMKMSGPLAKPQVPGKGTINFIGGTGKYAGIQGVNEYVTYSLRPAAEGIFQSYNKAKITYKLP